MNKFFRSHLGFLGIIIFVLLLTLIAKTPVLIRPKNLRLPVKFSPVVRLVEDGRTFCSGVVITKDLLVTAGHCVVEQENKCLPPHFRMSKIEIRADNNKSINVFATTLSYRPQFDTALLKGDFSLFEPRVAIMDFNTLLTFQKKGTPFIACGYPLAGDMVCKKIVFEANEDFVWRVKGLLLPGMSGGPVFSIGGEVIAINDAVDKNFSIVSPLYNLNFDFPKEDK